MTKLIAVFFRRNILPLYCFCLFNSCTPTAYFTSANEVLKEKAVLYLRDQTKLSGDITVYFETTFNTQMQINPYIFFLPEGKTTEEKISLNDITGYSIGSDYYALKEVDLLANNVKHLLFVKRLTTEESKIQLYELYESGRGNPTNEVKYSYYLSLPAFDALSTINTRSVHIVPDFDQKMSEIVSDCPSLAKKIKSKESGYFIPFASFKIKKHPEVLMKIIDEYNKCDLTSSDSHASK